MALKNDRAAMLLYKSCLRSVAVTTMTRSGCHSVKILSTTESGCSKLTTSLVNVLLKFQTLITEIQPGRLAQSVGHLTRKSEILGSIPGRAANFRFFFR